MFAIFNNLPEAVLHVWHLKDFFVHFHNPSEGVQSHVLLRPWFMKLSSSLRDVDRSFFVLEIWVLLCPCVAFQGTTIKYVMNASYTAHCPLVGPAPRVFDLNWYNVKTVKGL